MRRAISHCGTELEQTLHSILAQGSEIISIMPHKLHKGPGDTFIVAYYLVLYTDPKLKDRG